MSNFSLFPNDKMIQSKLFGSASTVASIALSPPLVVSTSHKAMSAPGYEGAVATAVPLPAGWVAFRDSEGEEYYFHPESNSTVWEVRARDRRWDM